MQSPCQKWQCLLNYVLQARDSELQLLQQGFNGTRSTLERVHLSQELLPLKWPWKINLASCLISWSLHTVVGVLGMQWLLHGPFTIGINCKPLDLTPTQCFMPREELTHSPEGRFPTHVWHLMHGALGLGQECRNGQDTAIVSKKFSLLGGRQSSQYYGM